MNAPRLSICIPTWNRATLLELLLQQLAREAQGLGNAVEIVVSDNASDDATAEVVACTPVPVVYGRQKRTVGFATNLLHATTVLASGEFVWSIGDDDLPLPGSVRRILDSLATAPDVDYHYVNFGWIDVESRNTTLRDNAGVPPPASLDRLQCDTREWRRLNRLEDLVFLPGYNPSALFAGIFCYVVRRRIYIDQAQTIRPSDSLDGASTRLDDAFPHAMLTLPPLAGKPAAYIGEPTILQGVNGWEWGVHASKTMIRSTHDLLEWLATTGFADDAIARLNVSYAEMAGRLLARMLVFPDRHAGIEHVLEKAIPAAVREPGFWTHFLRVIREESPPPGNQACPPKTDFR